MQTSPKLARKPKLNGLKGTSTIPIAIREALNIPDGILIAQFKDFSSMKCLAVDYFQNQVDSLERDAKIVRDSIIVILDEISSLVVKEVKYSKKAASRNMVIINEECVYVNQAFLMVN